MLTAELGTKYRDTISGFEGTAVARTEWLNGCVRITLSGSKDGEPSDHTFDEAQLEVIATGEPVASPRPGGDRPSAPRTGS